LACAIAYAELLKKEGVDTETVLPGSLNKSITEKIKKWKLNFSINPGFKNAKYILVDISDPKFFADFVKEKDVIEVFDHRTGFENYWKERIGSKAKIETVGSCTTLIWEEFEKRVKPLKITETSARLLSTATVSNTLNFNASVTTKRDIRAYKNLKSFSHLPENWVERYFETKKKSHPKIQSKQFFKIQKVWVREVLI